METLLMRKACFNYISAQKHRMIKDIFFDIGDVLINIYPKDCIQYWADSTDLKKEELHYLGIETSELN